jgi:hypothetical protein
MLRSLVRFQLAPLRGAVYPRGIARRGVRSAPVFRALVVVAVLAAGVLLGACGSSPQPSASDLTACGTVNNMASGAFVVDPLAEQETLAAQLVSQAKAASNARLITAAEQLQAATAAQSSPRVNAALTELSAACTAMGVGPSNGGI